MNITREDIIGMSGLDEDEVAAIAEHEHLPEVVAAALADYLLHSARGAATIRSMIKDDIRAALERGDEQHASLLFKALHRFVTDHPPM
ncbi:MAG TPA: hypothetical protein VMP03_02605 [Methylomirabilota bacterium]|nr:hypothetical protein [Methylomirabilota bacterium]